MDTPDPSEWPGKKVENVFPINHLVAAVVFSAKFADDRIPIMLMSFGETKVYLKINDMHMVGGFSDKNTLPPKPIR